MEDSAPRGTYLPGAALGPKGNPDLDLLTLLDQAEAPGCSRGFVQQRPRQPQPHAFTLKAHFLPDQGPHDPRDLPPQPSVLEGA